jgi:3-dehydroquinate synthase
MTRVPIRVSPRSYSAFIQSGLLHGCGEHLRKLLKGTRLQLFVVTVAPVRRRWGAALVRSLSKVGFRARVLEMLDGEPHKKLSTVEKLAGKLSASGADRDSIIIAFGGGVVGDTVGLLASLYMRGVHLIHIPTTLQAQVDASIGGKTGVNLASGKNLLGTFHQPLAVLIDPNVLSTLPDRQFRAGLYECLKCGVIGDPGLFRQLEATELKQLRNNPDLLHYVIAQSVKLKAKIVSADERERSLRRVLNFGHTIGHALEAESAYGRFLHGEAVGWGMIAAATIAQDMGYCDRITRQRISDAVFSLGPLPKVKARPGKLLPFLRADKKTRNGHVHFVLPRAIGRVEITNGVPNHVVTDAIQSLRQVAESL